MPGTTKPAAKATAGSRVVVVGASAGGFDALSGLAEQLPKGFPAAVFFVLHVPADFDSGRFVDALQRRSALRVQLARDGVRFRAGTIYVAPAEAHTLIKGPLILVTKGAAENRYRPAIDPLFRSAAVAHGPKVIGVLLTGMLDDGTAGLDAIERCCGVTVVQEPSDAAFPAMPQSALDNVRIDHRARLAKLGPLLETLVRKRPSRRKRPSDDILSEAIIAERVVSDVHAVDLLGDQVPYNCPACGGVLWEMAQPKVHRYRCHVGHAFTGDALLATQSEKIEETLWVTLRMLEERRNLSYAMAKRGRNAAVSRSANDRAKEADVHIGRIREMLGAGRRGKSSSAKPPAAAR
jgi:two-component system chemotaxis response regulator CheB